MESELYLTSRVLKYSRHILISPSQDFAGYRDNKQRDNCHCETKRNKMTCFYYIVGVGVNDHLRMAWSSEVELITLLGCFKPQGPNL